MMLKPDITGALRDRRSARSFDPRAVEPELIDALIEAIRWAPSSQNKQPWRLILVESKEAQAAWDAALDPGNQAWATRAPLKLVLVANADEQPDRDGQQRCLIDAGIALHALLVQACAMALNVRAMAGWNEQRVRDAFGLPTSYQVVALVAVGHPGRVEELPPEVQQKEARPRTRREATEIVLRNRFGVGASG